MGRRILALRPGALGDTLLALPSLEALRRSVGDSGAVDLVGTEPFVRLACSPEHASAVFSIERSLFAAFHEPEVDDRELLAFLGGYHLVVAWSRLPLLGAKLAPLGIPAIEASPHPPAETHASDHLYRSLEPLGIRGPTPLPRVALSPASRSQAREILARAGLRAGAFVALHPSSGSPRKNWPLEKFAALARLVRAEGIDLVWIEGEADRGFVTPLRERVPAEVVRDAPLEALGALLADALWFFGNDSGVSHLAAACGAPTTALFGPTDPRTWAPRGRLVTVVDFGESPERVWAKALERFGDR